MQNTYKQLLITAYTIAQDSPDPNTQNGALIVKNEDRNKPQILGQGCNTFPRGVSLTSERLERPVKYAYIEHAERNAIFNAAIGSGYITGSTMVCPFAACADCARAIIQCHIKKLVIHQDCMDLVSDYWQKSINYAFHMFAEAQVEIIAIQGHLGAAPIRFHDTIWTP